jgi:ubiquitin C-terminal hydrolase
LVNLYWNQEQKGCINLKPIIQKFYNKFPRFKNNNQHDVQESILCIIDILETSIPELKQLFYGKKTQETIWPGGKNVTDEDFSIHIVRSNGKDLGEMLNKSTDWNCIEDFEDKDGKKYNVATTRMLFSKLSPVLMISFDTKSNVKIVENIVIDKFKYKLISTVIHVGNQYDGHYVSFINNDDIWYYINDDFICKKDLPFQASHYFLIYLAQI